MVNYMKSVPGYVWIITLVCYILLIPTEIFVPWPEKQLAWTITLIPCFFFSYQFGLMGGFSISLLTLTLNSLWLCEEFLRDYLQYSRVIEASGLSIATFGFAIGTSVLSEKLHEKRKYAERLAYEDTLTGLYSRLFLYQQIDRYVKQTERKNITFALLFLDIDDFKLINDTYGHDTGDSVLRNVAQRLEESIHVEHITARLGGDEFAVVLTVADMETAELEASRILNRISLPIELDGVIMTVSCSIGISMFPKDGSDVKELFQKSDLAMYSAKHNDKNGFRFYQEGMRSELLDSKFLEQRMRQAFEKNQFVLYYQPQAEMATKKVIGFEALLRWHDPEEGFILPSSFIPTAERTGLIIRLGKWVLNEACRQCKDWQTFYGSNIRISVNVSVIQFLDPAFVSQVREALEKCGLAPSSLELEITESISMLHEESCLRKLDEIKSLGVRLSLDDFGTGFSSLGCLVKYAVDAIKIDKSFTQSIQSNYKNAFILESVLSLAHLLDLEVIAEGVETEMQYSFYLGLSCDFFQGYYQAPPLSAAESSEWLRKNMALNRNLETGGLLDEKR
ncbi:putative bifunctional diguanylate cyclase/phosphodiesterase [Paenibacillus sedimenti]|uniref:EAL domain-containing protein n=1 Tax=Paenibacillus sedimenti TaxID=2770274 RepID=A0A926QMB4_9BACL|nr:EAL domain-containing protein [Paenibacillus sedimenti]MBD0384490.1 EAL domain-containing protein [Paenibacillus sedimenti]